MPAVLFDLDGTLLDIDLDGFLRDYFHALAAVTARHFPGVDIMTGILASTGAMQRPHPGATNREAFDEDFLRRTGIDLRTQGDWAVFQGFYEDVFPTLSGGAGPSAGACRAVETALGLGLPVAVATQPIFPLIAIEHRLAWAGLSDLGLTTLTTYETMHACKPLPAYFRETAEMLATEPRDCIMVGDDRTLDMPAADVGMRTFYTGSDPSVAATWHGDLNDFSELLVRLVATDS